MCERIYKGNTKDSDAWRQLNQNPQNAEDSERLWCGDTRLNWSRIKCSVQFWSVYHLNVWSQPWLPQRFESHGLVVLFVGGAIKDSTSKKKEQEEKLQYSEEKKYSVMWRAISPAERLNGISIQEIMIPGDGRDVDGKLGIWAETVELTLGPPRCRFVW